MIQVDNIDVEILAFARHPDSVKVNQLFIVPEYQNRGIGAACIMSIIKDAAVSKLPVRLQVLKVNSRAFAFFQRFGFISIGESDTHILMESLSNKKYQILPYRWYMSLVNCTF